MIAPYYDVGQVTIYNADCADVLPTIDPADVALVLTDPPYGIDFTSSRGEKIHGDDVPFDPTPLLRYGRCVIWGANYFAHLLPPSGWLVWSKAQDNRYVAQRSTAEVAWTNCQQSLTVYNCFWAGSPLYRKSERGTTLHPTQKPVELMSWIVDRFTKPGDLVFDPYMGSGPVARACADLGRRYIGVELVEDYCRIAVDRLRQQALDLGGAA